MLKNILIALIISILILPSIGMGADDEVNIELKWLATWSGGHYHPVMGDIDSDGTMEIVATGRELTIIDGKTGEIEWSTNEIGSWPCQAILVDINNDGEPEIVSGYSGLRVGCWDGDGTLLWTSLRVRGATFPGTPLTAWDIDGTGQPYIFVVTLDTTSPFTARISKIDYQGNIVAESAICYKPCWGGLALADADFNGWYEIYLGDRASRGGPDGITNGLSCYNATTLETMWTRPDLYHSTPAPVLIDVDGDGQLDVIGSNIINNGCCVVNAITGEDIYNWKGRGNENHAKPTLYDIDLDGNVEAINSMGYFDAGYRGFTVQDMVTGEFDLITDDEDIDDAVTYPPTVGDITGDGILDIICVVSTESGWGEVKTGKLIVFDHNYNEIFRYEDFPRGEQLWEGMLYDCDSDGLFELIIGGRGSHVWCFDTDSPVPDRHPRTWSNWYGEYNQGAAIYVPPPGVREDDDEPDDEPIRRRRGRSHPLPPEPVIPNRSPELNIYNFIYAKAGYRFPFIAIGTDPDDDKIRYIWITPQGIRRTDWKQSGDASLNMITFYEKGIYKIIGICKDEHGLSDIEYKSVLVV